MSVIAVGPGVAVTTVPATQRTNSPRYTACTTIPLLINARFIAYSGVQAAISSKHRDRGGSVRFNSGKRPASAHSKGSPTGGVGGAPSRTNSVSHHKRQSSKDYSPLLARQRDQHGMGSNRQLEVVRNMDPDSKID